MSPAFVLYSTYVFDVWEIVILTLTQKRWTKRPASRIGEMDQAFDRQGEGMVKKRAQFQ
jgi:hypothetical protein